MATGTKYYRLFDEYTKILIEYGRLPRGKALIAWLERYVFKGVDDAPSQAEHTEEDLDVPTEMDPRNLQDLEGDVTVELEDTPVVSDNDETTSQGSASNQRAAAIPAPASSASRHAVPPPAPLRALPAGAGRGAPSHSQAIHPPQAGHRTPAAADADARPMSSQVSYGAAPLGSTSSGSQRIRAIPATAMSTGMPVQSSSGVAETAHLEEDDDEFDYAYFNSFPQSQPLSDLRYPSPPPAHQPAQSEPISSQLHPPPQTSASRPSSARRSQSQADAPDALAAALAGVDLGQAAFSVHGQNVVVGTLPTTVDSGPVEDVPRVAASRKPPARRGGASRGHGRKVVSGDVLPEGEPAEPPVAAQPAAGRATRSRSRAT